MLRDSRGTLLLVGNLAVLRISASSRFKRDVKTCEKRRWDMKLFKATIAALAKIDEEAVPRTYRDHALSGALAGRRSVHVPTMGNPPKDIWVIMYEVDGDELYLYRTGTHDEVYGR